MMSSTKTMNPTMPPPVPACHGFALMVETGAASASMKKESCKSAAMTRLNMLAVSIGDVWETEMCVTGQEKYERDDGEIDGCCLVLLLKRGRAQHLFEERSHGTCSYYVMGRVTQTESFETSP
jgi:hypothetical protein